jgi:hypothetical protein
MCRRWALAQTAGVTAREAGAGRPPSIRCGVPRRGPPLAVGVTSDRGCALHCSAQPGDTRLLSWCQMLVWLIADLQQALEGADPVRAPIRPALTASAPFAIDAVTGSHR